MTTLVQVQHLGADPRKVVEVLQADEKGIPNVAPPVRLNPGEKVTLSIWRENQLIVRERPFA